MAKIQSGSDEFLGIAVIGMAGRFPQAADVDSFWELLCAGREGLSRFSAAALRAAGVPPALLSDPRYVPVNGPLADIELFDASFFNMNPREASITDPQHRLFLELAWEALEHSGHDPANYHGAIGVYAGCGSSSYLLHNLWSNRAALADIGELRARMANSQEYLATRVSYKLNLTGPSININTACSTSLVAVHMACDALLNFQCDMALGGGISIQAPQVKGYLYEEGGILSPDGHCRAFDAAAQGTVSGNGGAVVVLKRLADALADGDTVYAVIRGSAINNDGADKAGYTAPSVSGQARVIVEAQAVAGIDADSIGYVETHGTGTPLGDPIELAALAQAFRTQTARTQFCAIGSVKTNVGHLDEAAGVTGLIKTVLSLYHRQIPPSLHFKKSNPEINFAASPFYVNTELHHWPTPPDGKPRRAAVSSFGIGGTNAHVVLEEAPSRQASSGSRSWQLLAISARTRTALAALASNLAKHLKANPDQPLADVCYTLQVGRTPLAQRRAVICHDTQDAVAELRRIEAGQLAEPLMTLQGERPVAFLFPGQGVQYVGMGGEVYETEPEFREEMDRCAERLAPLLGCDVREMLYPRNSASRRSPEERRAQVAAGAEQLSQTAIAQPVLFSFQYALARLWMSWGVSPQAMLGHSLGQYVAATLAGVLTLEDALDLVAARGRLLQQVERGAMLAVGLTESELQPLLGSSLSLAAVNSPSMCVASGPTNTIAVLEEELARRDVFHRRLQTSHAFHSAMVQPAVEAFAQSVRQVELKPPQIPFLSNVSGTWITADETTDPDYWARHMRATVRFSENVEELLRRKDLLFLEIGPGQTLATHVKRHANVAGRKVLSCTAHPHASESAAAVLMGTVGQLWEAGGQVDWRKFHAHHRRQRLPLPTYPFERERYWIDPPTGDTAETVGPTSRALVAATERRRPRSEGPNAPDANAVLPAKIDRPECDYVKEWIRVPAWRSSESRVSERLGAPACWLVFVDEVGLASSLSERLRNAGNTVVEVVAGDRFERLGPESFVIAPGRAADYAALWDELLAIDRQPARILHLWNVTRHDASRRHMDDFSYYSLLFLAHTIGSRPKITYLKIDVISNGLHHVDDGDSVCAEKALLLGPVRVMPLEYPQWRCRSIDVVLDESNSKSIQFLADRIFSELADGGDDSIVALRGNRRCIPTLVPVADKSTTTRLRERGVYLITGGLGSMGLALAQHLAERVQARLVLVGRSNPYSAAARLPSSEARFAEWESRRERELGIRAIDSYDNLETVLNELCASLAWEYFASRGGGLQPGESCKRDVLRSRLRVLPQFKRFFERLLSFLTAAEIIQVTYDVVMRTPLEPRRSADVRREIEQRFPSFAGLARLLSHCASQYGPALSGEIEAISVLYPDGTSAFLDECLHGTAECTNDRLYLQLVADILADLPSTGRPLRILEVGGGSGSLTRVVVDRLRGRSVEYWFTDLGRSFVVAAQREAVAQGIEFMRFTQLDISRDPRAQGFAETGFDAVIGYNVVHATPDIVQCLGHLAGLLAPGGLLMLAETVRPRRWIDMIWGLSEAWWCYQDEALREGGPLLALDRWQRAFATQHFENVITLPSDSERRAKTDSGLVLAQRPSLAASEDSRNFVDDEMRRKLRKLEDIERVGGEVLVAQADVTDKFQMQKVVEQARQRFGAIHGVIHAAGVLGQRLIHTKTVDPVSAVLAPKVAGTRVLGSVLGEQDLDFFVMCSSMASTRPIAGQVDYCAANAFLDAFAHEWTCGSAPCVSIDWGFWQELGMVEQSNMPQSQKQEIVDEIRRKGWSRAGVAAFEHILQCNGVRQVLVAPEFAEGTPAPGKILSHPWFESRQVEATGLESYIAHLSPDRHWVLDEHRVHGKPTLPGTAYLEMARAAFTHREGEGPVELRNVYFLSPLILELGEARETRTVLKPQREGCSFHVVSRVGGDRWEEHARGEVLRLLRTNTDRVGDELTERCQRLETAVRPNDDGFAQRVAAYPPRWRNIMRFQFEDDQGLALIQLPHPFAPEAEDYGLHPALLDNATGFLSHRDNLESSLPFCYQRVVIHRPLPSRFFSHVRRAGNGQPGMKKYDVLLFDSQGATLVQIDGFTMREVEVESRTSRQFQAPDRALPAENFAIEIASPGHLESLRFSAASRREPSEGELEIEVAAAGLNFNEVLYALGMLPTSPGLQVRFGLECSGRVTKVGPDVVSFAVGDEVIAMSPRAFSHYTLASVNATARKPDHLSFLEAATLPAAYVTAWYSLITKANLQRGERVLIHSAAGGVGLAAVHIARHIGAEVFTTAGNEEKRDYLRKLDIPHVMDSRSLRFVDDVKSQTRGEGVDVVVNSLGGEFIAGGLSVLRRYGRFLELGKRDIFKGTKLDLQHFEKHLSFMAIDVGPDLPDFASLWRDVVQRFHDGTLPPLPHQAFPITAMAPAMEFMAQARHLGKIVLEIAGCRVTPTGLVGAPVGLPLAEIIGPLESALDPSTLSPGRSPLVAGHSRPELETPYLAPRNDTERQLVEIWQQLLGIDRVGVDDNFFDLHGDSLLAAQLVSRVQRVLHVALPISVVFDATTVARQAECINQLRQPIAWLEPATSATVEHEEGNI